MLGGFSRVAIFALVLWAIIVYGFNISLEPTSWNKSSGIEGFRTTTESPL
jgi:hypothetical protein